MSKAEELAEKAYPKGDTYIFGDASIACQVAYVKGYHQAEKNLALTWEDIKEIYFLFKAVLNEWYGHEFSDEGICREVLKRFKEKKREEV